MNYIVERFVIVLGLLVAVNTPMSTDESELKMSLHNLDHYLLQVASELSVQAILIQLYTK